MYNVAICDDDKIDCDDLVKRCGAILTTFNVLYEIFVFASVEELEFALSSRAEPYDLLLLDILLAGKNGVEFGISMRQSDDKTGIIFITCSDAYAIEGYKAQPCNYLLKPVSDEALANAIRLELKRHNKHQIVEFNEKGRTVRLAASEILYVESYEHGILVHTKSETFYFFISLSQAKDILPNTIFTRCHHSYIVNLTYIISTSSTKVIFRGGEELPVGRSYRDKFHSIFINHFF